jgi:hypothetical protein
MIIYFGLKELLIKAIKIENQEINHVSVFKLTWDDHMDYICGKASKRVYFLTLLK